MVIVPHPIVPTPVKFCELKATAPLAADWGTSQSRTARGFSTPLSRRRGLATRPPPVGLRGRPSSGHHGYLHRREQEQPQLRPREERAYRPNYEHILTLNRAILGGDPTAECVHNLAYSRTQLTGFPRPAASPSLAAHARRRGIRCPGRAATGASRPSPRSSPASASPSPRASSLVSLRVCRWRPSRLPLLEDFRNWMGDEQCPRLVRAA